jgi:hypothetical protein
MKIQALLKEKIEKKNDLENYNSYFYQLEK